MLILQGVLDWERHANLSRLLESEGHALRLQLERVPVVTVAGWKISWTI
jgi:hypothetical protein